MKDSRLEDHMAAVAFAEAGEFDSAREMLGQGGGARKAAPAGVKRPYLKALVFGGVSLALYLTLFTHLNLVMDKFTLGGWYTLLPVGTAFLFSFIHGAFASNLLSVLNLEAKK